MKTLLALLVLVSGVTASAQIKSADEITTALKVMVACDNTGILAAKEFDAIIMIGIASLADDKIVPEFTKLMTDLTQMKTCQDTTNAYDAIKAMALKLGVDLEQYYATPEGKQSIEASAATIKKSLGGN
jgi:purine nucleoside permease